MPKVTLDVGGQRVEVEVDTARAEAAVEAAVLRGLEQAGAWLALRKVKEAINRGNRAGRDPSLPGEPPKKVTGRLQKSIAYTVGPDPDGLGLTLLVGTNVAYAPHLELGTSRMAARPFLRPTLMQNRDQVARLILANLR